MSEEQPAPAKQRQLMERTLSPGMQRPPVTVVSQQQSVADEAAAAALDDAGLAAAKG